MTLFAQEFQSMGCNKPDNLLLCDPKLVVGSNATKELLVAVSFQLFLVFLILTNQENSYMKIIEVE